MPRPHHAVTNVRKKTNVRIRATAVSFALALGWVAADCKNVRVTGARELLHKRPWVTIGKSTLNEPPRRIALMHF